MDVAPSTALLPARAIRRVAAALAAAALVIFWIGRGTDVDLAAVKTVTKVAGSVGDKVQPGDTLEYRVVIRNSGTLPAGGVTFSDALPAGSE